MRRPGGGRKPLTATDPGLIDDLRSLVEPYARGDLQSPLLWTCKSLRKLSQSLSTDADDGRKLLLGARYANPEDRPDADYAPVA